MGGGKKDGGQVKTALAPGLEKSSRRDEVKLIDNKGGFDSIENFFHLASGGPPVVVGGLPAGNQPLPPSLFFHPDRPLFDEHRRAVSVDR